MLSLRLFSPPEWRQLFLTFFLTFACFGLLQYFCFPDTTFLENLGWDDHYYRLIGTWFDPAFTALALNFGLIYGFFYLIARKNKKAPSPQLSVKIFTFIYFSFLFSAFIFTYSRSNFLALFLVALVYFFSRRMSHLPTVTTTVNSSTPFFSAKKALFPIFLVILLLVAFFAFTARRFPSDSTNLLRTNSIDLRFQALQQQIAAFSLRTWLIGNGFFAAPNFSFSPISSPSMISPVFKNTAVFPDNFFLLLLSFFGLPLTIFILSWLYRFFHFCWRQQPLIFYLALALLVVAQFNQAAFQPFVLILFGFLLISQFQPN